MSERGDARRIISDAEEAGMTVLKLKHGGYGVYTPEGEIITRIPANGSAGPRWIKRVRRDLSRYGVNV